MSNKRTHFQNILWLTIIVTVAVAVIVGVSYSLPQAAEHDDTSIVQIENHSSTRAQAFRTRDTAGDAAQTAATFSELPDMSTTGSASQYPLIQSVNGVEIELHAVHIVGEYLHVDICYPMPSDADWLPGDGPGDVVLNIGTKSIPIWGYKLLDLQISPEGTRLRRCDVLQFPVATEQDLIQFTLTIYRLVTSVPEQPDCSQAQEKLATTGIVIQCHHAESMFSYEVVQKPAALTETQAHDLVYEAFMEIVEGPWVFTSSLEK